MKNIKKILTTFVFFAIFIILGIINVNASSSDLYLNNLEFKAEINTDGSMKVTEIWDIDIEDTNTLYKTFKPDETKYSEINDVTVKETTNGEEKYFYESSEWAYHLEENYFFGGENSDGLYEIAWGLGLDSDSDTRKYEISYTVEDAIAKYSDYAELYWQFVGEDFEISAKNVKGTIILPYNANSKEDIKVWGHTEDLNGEIYTTDLNKIEFNINTFRSGRYIEVRTLFPSDMIYYSARSENQEILEDVIEEETVWANIANEKRERKEKINAIVGITIVFVCAVLSIILVYNFIKNMKKSNKLIKFKPTQEIIYYREIPREKESTPAEALYIYQKLMSGFSSIHIGRVFAANLLDLSLKKLIDFEVTKQENKKEIITIKLLKEDCNNIEIPSDETTVFQFVKIAMRRKE